MLSPEGCAIFGASAAMREVLEQVRRASRSRAGVLICGERGSGRRMVARAIHRHDNLPKPLVIVDCGTGAGPDLETDLFGGRAVGRDGSGGRRWIERISRSSRVHEARGGTLLLEHIVDMPANVQARLARLLRDDEAVVAEDGRRAHLGLRPIATAEPTFGSAVDEGRVRSDLYKRIAVIRIDVPPLRQRREDISALASHFLGEACLARKVPQKTLDGAALVLLLALPWRHNGWELRRLMEGLVALVPGPVIRLEDVLANIRLDNASSPVFVGSGLREARRRFERDYIAAALEQHHWRIGEAAVALGIQRTNLYRKMRELRVARKSRRAT